MRLTPDELDEEVTRWAKRCVESQEWFIKMFNAEILRHQEHRRWVRLNIAALWFFICLFAIEASTALVMANRGAP